MTWILSKLAASRVCGGSHLSRPFVHLHTHLISQSIWTLPVPRGRSSPGYGRGRGRTHGGPGRRSTYLVSRTVRLVECSLKTHLGGYLHTALRIAVNRYMPMRWPALPHSTEASHRFTPCSVSPPPPPLARCPNGLSLWTASSCLVQDI